jgi:hypothetical protein
MASTTNYATMTTEALAAHSMRMFEVLFWDVCKTNEWSVLNKDGSEVDMVALTKAMLSGMAHGPSEKMDVVNMEEAYSRVDIPAKEPVPVAAENKAPEPVIVAPPVIAASKKIDPKKIKKMEFKGTKIDMPYIPSLVDYSKCCQGIKICGGLLAPCLTHVKEGGFCKPCQKMQDEGKADGTLTDRQSVPLGSFESKKSGKKEISFATYLQKRDITVEEFNTYLATEIGESFQIPNEPAYMDVDKKRARKAKKTKKETEDASDEESVGSTEEQPKKQDEVVETVEKEVVEETVSPMQQEDDSKVTDEEHDEDSGITSFKFEGKAYARDPENTVFALNDEKCPVAVAGSWDPISNAIIFKDGYEA